MYLHKNIFYLVFFLIIYFPSTKAVRNKNLVLTKSGLADVSACSIGLQFFSTINNTSDEDFIVELISDECCIHSGEALDCDSVEIIGETVEVIRKGNVKTFKLVAPVLDPFERKGYCTIHLDSRPIDKRNLIMRDTIKIDFDTRLKNVNAPNSDENIKLCKNEDEDPLNDCKPVNCDTYYNGKKPIFDKIARKCVEVPKCKEMKSGENIFFDPTSNTCIDGEHIDIDDIEYIKSISHNRHAKDVIIIESDDTSPVSNSNKSDIVITEQALAPTVLAKTSITKKEGLSLYFDTFLPSNKYSIAVLAMVFSSQCVIICTMIYCLTKGSADKAKKKVERKYFNYRQDASVTTPLITTSNIDTETAACEFISESSTLDRKIQCYKACQKQRNNDAKLSMSDDILSKCLNRRNWNPTAKSDTVNNVHNLNNINNFEWHPNKDKQTVQEVTTPEKSTSKNVAYGKEIESTIEVQQVNCECRKIKEDYTDSDSSEKLIQCLDYNIIQGRNRSVTKKFANQTAASIVSAEKGAQASFSKDSADEFLSERGMIFLSGDGLSKYSYTSDSTPKSSLLTSTSKTSKNNILKNVLSYLSKKSRALTTSDPGMKKIKCKGKDLELIHMSQASMYSSSASEYRKLNKVKVAKDSSTSF